MQTIDVKNKLVIGKEYAGEVIEAIDRATISIKVLMFDWRWYTDDFMCDVSCINQSIVRAVRRGVKVMAVTNYLNVVEQLKTLGIQAKKWNSSKLMHSKGIVIDGKVVIMGSHNFTKNAMSYNVETSIVVNDEAIAGNLSAYFDSLWQSS